MSFKLFCVRDEMILVIRKLKVINVSYQVYVGEMERTVMNPDVLPG